ncbi:MULTISPECIES: hypothetical protein [unclassified Bradyrhizobium]|uniref:hypothetical protein n=1 Tax=unclassified Bradyrhizobium TaxID=2631580 RepID=UPI001FF9FC6A|nr:MULTISPECIES: hypothetical protein [unclassified Bradyrhizobium]MCK1713077.1 hypothetical protein [Bradyrhizobium sp. 143]MCK1730499.1 hypothetical protein [Bradyrhizobium sp. 142]
MSTSDFPRLPAVGRKDGSVILAVKPFPENQISRFNHRPWRGLDSITQAFDTLALGAMLATEKGTRLLQAVSDDTDSTMIAGRRERVNGAFEAIERMRFAVHRDLKGLVIIIAAGFTCRHDLSPSPTSQMYPEVAKWHLVPAE